jgi:hypothetical protein
VTEQCYFCSEPIEASQEVAEGRFFDAYGNERRNHRECALRAVVGGIGHLTDHILWCVVRDDPDAGRTWRQSSLEVDAWVREHGWPSA